MNCHDFKEIASNLALVELSSWSEEKPMEHVRSCTACAGWLQQRQTVAAGLHALRTSMATLEAGAGVEQQVLRAFRKSRDPQVTAPRGLRILHFPTPTGWRWPAFAAAAAALAIAFGLDVWFWQHPTRSTQQMASRPAVQQAIPEAQKPTPPQREEVARAGSRPPGEEVAANVHASTVASSGNGAATMPTSQSLPQVADAQDYVPLMLCDPLSCSGDEQVVRMEIPATSVDASSGAAVTLLADVVVGDDGLVRAIRIVQQ